MYTEKLLVEQMSFFLLQLNGSTCAMSISSFTG